MERNAPATEIALVQPRGTIGRDGLTFKWTSGPDVRSCRLEIYDRSLEPVYRSGPLDANAYSLPAGALAGIRKDEVYFWKVVATLKDEQPVESEFAKFIAH